MRRFGSVSSPRGRGPSDFGATTLGPRLRGDDEEIVTDIGISPRARSLDPHARLRAVVGGKQEDAGAIARRGEHHAFGQAEFHLARREVRDHRRQAADQQRRIVRRLDAGEDRARLPVADVERQLQQLVRTFDVFGIDDARDAQVDLREIVDGDLRCRGSLGPLTPVALSPRGGEGDVVGALAPFPAVTAAFDLALPARERVGRGRGLASLSRHGRGLG